MNVANSFFRLTVVILICSATLSAHAADSDRSIRWLKETPVNLWEYGLMRLDKHVSGWPDEDSSNPLSKLDGEVATWATDDNNNIMIIASNHSDSTKENCRNYLTAIREDANVRDGKVFYGGVVSYYARAFDVRGDRHLTEPDGYLEHVDDLIMVDVFLRDVSCGGPLVSSDIEYYEDE